MIEKIYKCADCGAQSKFTSKHKARDRGWAVARDCRTCYCPACAVRHRNTGRNGARPVTCKQIRLAGGGGNA